MVGERRREILYGELPGERRATRMVRDGRHKLIWYPAGNLVQLFDLDEDPGELHDLADDPDYAAVRARLEAALVDELGVSIPAGSRMASWRRAGPGLPGAAKSRPVRPARPALPAAAACRPGRDGGLPDL